MTQETKVIVIRVPLAMHTAYKQICAAQCVSMQAPLFERIKATVEKFATPAKARP